MDTTSKTYKNAINTLKKEHFHRLSLPLGGLLTWRVNSKLTRHKTKVFKQFEREALLAFDGDQYSKEYLATIMASKVLAARWLAKFNPEHFSYSK